MKIKKRSAVIIELSEYESTELVEELNSVTFHSDSNRVLLKLYNALTTNEQ